MLFCRYRCFVRLYVFLSISNIPVSASILVVLGVSGTK